MDGRFVLARTAGVEVYEYPSVGRAESTNGPAIYDICLKELDGFVVGGGGFGEEEESLISVSNFLIDSYCFVVVAVRRVLASVIWKSVRPMLVAESAILLRWLSRDWRAKSPVGVVAVSDTA